MDPFEKGLDSFSGGRFFEAHEEWERIWMTSSGDERLALQALIQLAAACVHLEKGRPGPAERLLKLVREKLSRAPAFRGNDFSSLLGDLEHLAESRKPVTLADLSGLLAPG